MRVLSAAETRMNTHRDSPDVCRGISADIFDVIVTAKGPAGILSSYPVVILAGEVRCRKMGKSTRQYVEHGGTLICADRSWAGVVD